MFRTRTHVGVFVDAAPGPQARAAAIVPHVRSQVTVLSSADPLPEPLRDELRVRLSDPLGGRGDGPPAAGDAVPPSLGEAGAAELVAWMEQESPDLLLVDGPSDVALFARLAGVPVALVRRHAARTDTQRQLIDRTAIGMLAPFPTDLEVADEDLPTPVVHTGLVSRFAGRDHRRDEARTSFGLAEGDRLVTVVCGQDGLGPSADELHEAAAATPGWRWHLLGRCGSPTRPGLDRVRPFGWVADPWPHLTAADVVLAGGSLSTVAEVATARVPLLLLPRPSVDHEERRLADALAAVAAAVPLPAWPAADRWAAILEAAAAMDPTPLAALGDDGAARRAAEWLDAWAALPASERTHDALVTEELDLLLDLEAERTSVRPASSEAS